LQVIIKAKISGFTRHIPPKNIDTNETYNMAGWEGMIAVPNPAKPLVCVRKAYIFARKRSTKCTYTQCIRCIQFSLCNNDKIV